MDNVKLPEQVLEFAKNYGYKNGLLFVQDWNGYKVYMPDYSCEKDSEFGLPRFILQNDDTIRWANGDERNELLHLGNHKN